MSESAVRIRDLVVYRGGALVLDGIDLDVAPGTVTGLVGPSGSGKTTLLRCVVGVQKIKSGRVTVLGRPAGTAALRHEVSYLTQSPTVYGDLTVEENVRHFAALYRRSKRDAAIVIERVGLSPKSRQLVRKLSGGQQTRANLACALVAAPRMLVLDEPTVGQDPLLRRELWTHFHNIARAEGTTIVVSSHVMDEAARCDRILLMRTGKIIADDTPEMIRKETQTDDLDEAFLRLIEAPVAVPQV
ncbi:ABC transporter ATP-binding protein [Actinomadura soli]|uniref:ABC transporter ATP-binding protein n=1 Tax=Actinomadura soli TaxID=2508997 RepID=A0A5C4JDN3_9ACTN|nr:ABC transporter ATP-binding protein [Actinomadura soli]TMR02593.1 ABC transporter ATP-binding protein [Actinomadura soli]